MISDDELEAKEAEVGELFGFVEERPQKAAQPTEDDERRIEQILVRVRVEALMKDTASFVFNSFGATMSGVLRAMFGVFPNTDQAEEQDQKKNSKHTSDKK